MNKDRTRRYFAEALQQAKDKLRFDVWAYVLMPDHVHLLIWPTKEIYSVSQILQSLKQSASRKAVGYLRKYNPNGLKWLETGQADTLYRFWQDGGRYDLNICSPKELLQVVRYIHNNPVKRGLVERPEDWIWSSWRDWQDLGEGPIPIDKDSLLKVME